MRADETFFRCFFLRSNSRDNSCVSLGPDRPKTIGDRYEMPALPYLPVLCGSLGCGSLSDECFPRFVLALRWTVINPPKDSLLILRWQVREDVVQEALVLMLEADVVEQIPVRELCTDEFGDGCLYSAEDIERDTVEHFCWPSIKRCDDMCRRPGLSIAGLHISGGAYEKVSDAVQVFIELDFAVPDA